MVVSNFADVPLRRRAEGGWDVHQSESLEVGFAAARAVASVQTAAPLGAADHVEMQARTSRNQSRWSPWLTMAVWRGGEAPSVPPSLRGAVVSPAGRVVVDQYVAGSAHLFRFLQLRVVASAGAPAILAAAVAARAAVIEPTAAAPPPGPPTVSEARAWPPPFCQFDHPREGARICSPSSVAWACAALRGEPLLAAPAALDGLLDRVRDPVHDLFGNWPRAIMAAGDLGVRGRLAYAAGWGDARGWLDAGHLVVASIRFDDAAALPGAPKAMPDGHLLVVLGDDPARGDVLVFDPAQPAAAPFPHRYPIAPFLAAWVGGSAVAYVLGPPRG